MRRELRLIWREFRMLLASIALLFARILWPSDDLLTKAALDDLAVRMTDAEAESPEC